MLDSLPTQPHPSEQAPPPLPALLQALQGLPHVGWVLKAVPTLAYVQWSGSLPMADPRLSRCAAAMDQASDRAQALSAGQTDAQHFDPTQASILRLADLRVLRQGCPSAEVHRIETLDVADEVPAMDWRAWRMVLSSAPHGPAQAGPSGEVQDGVQSQTDQPAGTPWLLVVWADMGFAERSDQLLAHAQRQIQAQQLLIAGLRAQLPAESGLSGSQASLAWAAQRFAQQLQREVDLSRREQRSFALLLLQMGRQDTPCSSAEQAVAGLLAQLLASGTRAMDTVAQVSERRFAVLLSGAQLTPAYTRAEALRRQAATQVAMHSGVAQPIDLFVGVAAYPLTAEQPDELEAAAQQALREALSGEAGCSVLARVPFSAPPS